LATKPASKLARKYPNAPTGRESTSSDRLFRRRLELPPPAITEGTPVELGVAEQ